MIRLGGSVYAPPTAAMRLRSWLRPRGVRTRCSNCRSSQAHQRCDDVSLSQDGDGRGSRRTIPDGHGFALTTVVMTSSPCVGVGVGGGVGVGDGDSDGDGGGGGGGGDSGGDGDGDGKAPCHTVAVGTTSGHPARTPAGVPAAAAEGGAMPGDVATLDDGIGRARVVGWSALDTVDPPACLLPGLAADAWWCELLADDIATIMIAAAAS